MTTTKQPKPRHGIIRTVTDRTHKANCGRCDDEWAGPTAPLQATAHVRATGHPVHLSVESTYIYEPGPPRDADDRASTS